MEQWTKAEWKAFIGLQFFNGNHLSFGAAGAQRGVVWQVLCTGCGKKVGVAFGVYLADTYHRISRPIYRFHLAEIE
ncbi:MAG: hypothetical protein H6557_13055 [Lewinellaceae bacterium]|nr:hypothetical protein [Phaeodactylibacter sp.]MCB9037537.1 hypothetical protein [Lewinellaceae bacterium]